MHLLLPHHELSQEVRSISSIALGIKPGAVCKMSSICSKANSFNVGVDGSIYSMLITNIIAYNVNKSIRYLNEFAFTDLDYVIF